MTEVRTLPPRRWREAKEIRLLALKTVPLAFGSSYEEEEKLSSSEWQKRMAHTLFAISEDKPVGTVTFHFNNRPKSKHIARIVGVFVDSDYRGRGIGRELLERALEIIQEKKGIVKIQLMVNPTQKAAVALYKSLGFVVVGKMKKEIKVGNEFYDELILEKLL
jgi:ribosomal protein S18 acetylase RimI-like enzyme